MRINQFHSGTAVGDAITNQMLMLQQALQDSGYQSEVFAEHIDSALQAKISDIRSYQGNKDNILIIHHSIGINPETFSAIKTFPDRKILIYHNITPEKYFDDPTLKKFVRLGLAQTKEYRDIVDYVIADSNFNRRNLLEMGYENTIDILPVHISLDRFDQVKANKKLLDLHHETTNILFVGRVVWNKRQIDLVKAFYIFNKYFNPESKLFLVGDDGMTQYVQEIKNLASTLGIKDSVFLTGKVSESDLKTYYEMADVFLCMSEHEGFGVPLLEAMKMEVPVVSFDSSAIPETMGGAGIVVNRKDYRMIAALLDELTSDTDLRNRIIQRQNARLQKLDEADSSQILLNAITQLKQKSRKHTLQLQGPFETTYSLAIVNRQLAEALDNAGNYDVSIYGTEGLGGYPINEKALLDKPHAKTLWEKSASVNYPDITIRNMYPPRVHDVIGGLNFFAFGWEESVVPKEYIDHFNRYLSGIGTMSNYVTEKLIECGLKIPVRTMGLGVELSANFDSLPAYPLHTGKKKRFLHISSAFPRKGVDVLLQAYFEAFDCNDDVCLVLKTFPNIHNKTGEILAALRQQYPNGPEVEWIDCDLSQTELESLYKAADCYVSVARGEGFGLPVAEAMLAKVPVIVSPNSGMADFCNNDTALLVGYDMERAQTHLSTSNNLQVSLWAEPRREDLKKQLRYFVFEASEEAIHTMVDKAHRLISSEFTWSAVAERWQDFINDVERSQKKPQVAMVTTWNNKCGIAEYTRMQIEASDCMVNYSIYPNSGVELLRKDEEYVEPRVWKSAFEGDMKLLVENLLKSPDEIVHFQFNFGFFKLEHLAEAIERLTPKKKVIITFHKTADAQVGSKIISLRTIARALNKCSALIIHQKDDFDRLVGFGVRKEILKQINLGQLQYPIVPSSFAKARQQIDSSLVIGSYGFLLPHKGILETIQAMPKVLSVYPDAFYMPVCALHESTESSSYIKTCQEEITRLHLEKHVRMETRFLPNDQSMQLLQSCDLMCMAYHPSMESASGAIRFCLAAGRPVITTKQLIFDEFADFTCQIKSADPELIADSILKLAKDRELQQACLHGSSAYISDKNWYQTAARYGQLYCSVLNR